MLGLAPVAMTSTSSSESSTCFDGGCSGCVEDAGGGARTQTLRASTEIPTAAAPDVIARLFSEEALEAFQRRPPPAPLPRQQKAEPKARTGKAATRKVEGKAATGHPPRPLQHVMSPRMCRRRLQSNLQNARRPNANA